LTWSRGFEVADARHRVWFQMLWKTVPREVEFVRARGWEGGVRFVDLEV
jgi:hypothetical protein